MDRGSDYYSVPSSSLEPPHSSGSGVDDETPSDRGSGTSQAWQNAIQRYLLELQKGGIRYQPIDRDLYKIKSPSELLNEIKSLQQPPSNSESIISLNKVVSSLNDFAAVVAFALGMNGRVAALLWGAFRILFNVRLSVQLKGPKLIY